MCEGCPLGPDPFKRSDVLSNKFIKALIGLKIIESLLACCDGVVNFHVAICLSFEKRVSRGLLFKLMDDGVAGHGRLSAASILNGCMFIVVNALIQSEVGGGAHQVE